MRPSIVVLTPRPAREGEPRRTSVEVYAGTVVRLLQGDLPIRMLCPAKRGEDGAGIRQGLRRAIALRPRLIQVENRPPWVTALRRLGYRGKIVLTLHSLNFAGPPRYPARRVCAAMGAADAVVCASRALAARLRARYGRRLPIRVIHPGVDLARFHPGGARAQIAAHAPTGDGAQAAASGRRPRGAGTGGRPVVLFAGRVVPQKGLDVLIRSLARVRAGHRRPLLLVAGAPRPHRGAGGYAGRLWQLARRLDVDLRSAGRLAHQRMPRLYRAADLVAVPSQRFEAFGLVNLEAMACGTPVVASALGGIPEAVGPGSGGLLVRPSSSTRAWVRQLTACLAHPSRAHRLSAQGPPWVRKRFPWTRTARRWLALYRQLLGNDVSAARGSST